jgi:hypothetical protein
MKKIITGFILSIAAGLTFASELVTIYSPYSASHSGNASMREILETANKQQNKYTFILEFKPGGEQILAVRAMDNKPTSSLSIIAPKYVEHVMSGKLDEDNYIPIHALGDACWAAISNIGNIDKGISSLAGKGEITVGGVGLGNATHLTSLQIAEKHGVDIRYILFKSNFDALVLMAGQDSINFVLERVQSYKILKEKNPCIKILGMSCPTRHPDAPDVATLVEQGIEAPYVFNITIAHKNMPEDKRNELKTILDKATLSVGEEKIRSISDMKPPIFSNTSIENYYRSSVELIKKLLVKHKDAVSSAK